VAVTLRLKCSWKMDSSFPRDRMVINPVFKADWAIDPESGLNPDSNELCQDLADGLSAWDGSAAEIEVKSYDLEGTKPVYPNGYGVANLGGTGSSGMPRETALCLSFYAGRNVPRRRGRLFLPGVFLTSAPGQRPTTAQMTNVGALSSLFEGIGGVNVDWCVWSTLDQEAFPVTNWWVDDEWDTVRSRGLRATTRITGTTSEA